MSVGHVCVGHVCVGHVLDSWWLSGCQGSVAEHWCLEPVVSWVRLLVTAKLLTFLYFCLITFISMECEARCYEHLELESWFFSDEENFLVHP